MKIVGVLLLIAALGFFIYGYNYDTSVDVEGTKWRIHNVGLMEERRLILIVSGLLAVFGVALLLINRKQSSEIIVKTEKDFFCSNCGALIELDGDDIAKGGYDCPECGKMNVITLNK